MMPTKNRNFCIDAGRVKMLFKSEGAAKRFIEFNAEDMKNSGKPVPKRAYYCISCGGWHLTSHEEAPKLKSKVERYFDKLDINADIQSLYDESVKNIIDITAEYLMAMTPEQKSFSRTRFNIIKEDYYEKCRSYTKFFPNFRPIVARLENLFNDKVAYEDLFSDINRKSKHIYHHVQFFKNRINDTLNINTKISSSL